jgi:hypothetical protein
VHLLVFMLILMKCTVQEAKCAVLGCLIHLVPLNYNHEASLGCAYCVCALVRAKLLTFISLLTE